MGSASTCLAPHEPDVWSQRDQDVDCKCPASSSAAGTNGMSTSRATALDRAGVHQQLDRRADGKQEQQLSQARCTWQAARAVTQHRQGLQEPSHTAAASRIRWPSTQTAPHARCATNTGSHTFGQTSRTCKQHTTAGQACTHKPHGSKGCASIAQRAAHTAGHKQQECAVQTLRRIYFAKKKNRKPRTLASQSMRPAKSTLLP